MKEEHVPKWRYVGPSTVHDASIVSVQEDGCRLIVNLSSSNDRDFCITFRGVKEKNLIRPEGMLLYSLSALEQGDLTLYCLTNWYGESENEYDGKRFEVLAEGFEASGDLREDWEE
ncbi:MAG: hypothetical protein H3C30_11205 [Candidatus Hydrogenedentes bacterium]|nr:hypothetical protein [Candidatus Hydrogenedentota bacterium]